MPRSAQATKKTAAAKPAGRGLADQLARIGVARDADLVLHLPLRYEDHTRLVPLASLAPGLAVQTEGVIVNTEIQYRPRRQLVCLIADPDRRDAQLVLRFFTFYPSQQKMLQPGARLRVFGDVRPGYFGMEIVHPQFKVVADDTPLPDRLTPVYPTTAGLAQETLRKLVARTLAADPAYTNETLPEQTVARRKLWKFGDAIRFLHTPPPRLSELTQRALDARTHPGVDAPQVRRAARAAAVAQGAPEGARAAARAGAHRHGRADEGAARARAVQADARAGARVARDRARHAPCVADAAAAAGRRRVRQDDRRGARRAAGDRKRQAGRVHGADRDPRRAALPQALDVARGARRAGRVAVRLGAREGAAPRTRGPRERRDAVRDRHARAVPGRRRAAEPRARDHRRAAPLRRRAAAGAARQGARRGAPAHDERDADPAHARDDVLRGPRRVGAGRDAARAHAGGDAHGQPEAPRRDRDVGRQAVRRGPAGVLGVPADRGVREARTADGRRAARGAHRRAAGALASACCTGG